MRRVPSVLALAMGLSGCCASPAWSSLISPGDISLLGFRSDNPDSFAFVLWTAVDDATRLDFFDSGYIGGGDGTGQGAGGGSWRATESLLSWTSGTHLAAGTVVVVAGNAADVGTTTGSLSALSSTGDQIFAGQGIRFLPGGNPSALSGRLLFGLDFNGSAGWDASATSTRTSALPGALLGHNLAFTHADNGQYVGARNGVSVEQLRALVADASNWSFGNNGATFGRLNSQDFSIGSPVPEPTALTLLLCGMPCLLLPRRRRNGTCPNREVFGWFEPRGGRRARR